MLFIYVLKDFYVVVFSERLSDKHVTVRPKHLISKVYIPYSGKFTGEKLPVGACTVMFTLLGYLHY